MLALTENVNKIARVVDNLGTKQQDINSRPEGDTLRDARRASEEGSRNSTDNSGSSDNSAEHSYISDTKLLDIKAKVDLLQVNGVNYIKIK